MGRPIVVHKISTYQTSGRASQTAAPHTLGTTVEFQVRQGFDRMLRTSRGHYTQRQYHLNQLHLGYAYEVVGELARELRDKMIATPRVNRVDRTSLRRHLYDPSLREVRYANRAGAGFTVDLTKLDHLAVDDQGRPYWRYVDQGFEGGMVRAMFRSPEGYLYPPIRGRTADPRMPQSDSSRFPLFYMKGFQGHDFIQPAFQRKAVEFRRRAFLEYVFDITGPYGASDEFERRLRAAAKALTSGGSVSAQNIHASSGRIVTTSRVLD